MSENEVEDGFGVFAPSEELRDWAAEALTKIKKDDNK